MLIETLSMIDELVHQPLSHRTHAFAVEWIDHSDDRQRALEKKHERVSNFLKWSEGKFGIGIFEIA